MSKPGRREFRNGHNSASHFRLEEAETQRDCELKWGHTGGKGWSGAATASSRWPGQDSCVPIAHCLPFLLCAELLVVCRLCMYHRDRGQNLDRRMKKEHFRYMIRNILMPLLCFKILLLANVSHRYLEKFYQSILTYCCHLFMIAFHILSLPCMYMV